MPGLGSDMHGRADVRPAAPCCAPARVPALLLHLAAPQILSHLINGLSLFLKSASSYLD